MIGPDHPYLDLLERAYSCDYVSYATQKHLSLGPESHSFAMLSSKNRTSASQVLRGDRFLTSTIAGQQTQLA